VLCVRRKLYYYILICWTLCFKWLNYFRLCGLLCALKTLLELLALYNVKWSGKVIMELRGGGKNRKKGNGISDAITSEVAMISITVRNWKAQTWIGIYTHVKAPSRNCEKRLIASVRMQQLGCHRKDFHKIWYLKTKICRENSRFIKIWQE